MERSYTAPSTSFREACWQALMDIDRVLGAASAADPRALHARAAEKVAHFLIAYGGDQPRASVLGETAACVVCDALQHLAGVPREQRLSWLRAG